MTAEDKNRLLDLDNVSIVVTSIYFSFQNMQVVNKSFATSLQL